MKWYEAAGIGVVMGCLYGVVLWASVLTRDAYFEEINKISIRSVFDTVPGSPLYNTPDVGIYNHTRLLTPDPNMVYMPYAFTGVVMLIAFTVLFSVPIWYPYALITFEQLADDVISGWRGEREDDEEVEE